jgi:hypothetical protein
MVSELNQLGSILPKGQRTTQKKGNEGERARHSTCCLNTAVDGCGRKLQLTDHAGGMELDDSCDGCDSPQCPSVFETPGILISGGQVAHDLRLVRYFLKKIHLQAFRAIKLRKKRRLPDFQQNDLASANAR